MGAVGKWLQPLTFYKAIDTWVPKAFDVTGRFSRKEYWSGNVTKGAKEFQTRRIRNEFRSICRQNVFFLFCFAEVRRCDDANDVGSGGGVGGGGDGGMGRHLSSVLASCICK